MSSPQIAWDTPSTGTDIKWDAAPSVESPIAPPGVPRPDINVQRIDPIGNRPEADVQADLVANRPWNLAMRGIQQAAHDAWTLSRSGAQAAAMVTGKPLLGQPASPHELIQSGANVASMMAGGEEGTPPTPRLNKFLKPSGIQSAPSTALSDPGFSIGKRLLREVPGVGGYLRKADLFNDIMNKVRGETAAAPPTQPATLPPEVPQVIRDAWAMHQGGQPASPAETGAALGSVPTPPSGAPRFFGPRAPTYQTSSALGTQVPSVFEGSQPPVNMRTTFPPEPTPPQVRPPRPPPAWKTNAEANVPRGTSPEPAAPVDPWANMKYDQQASKMAQAERDAGTLPEGVSYVQRAQQLKEQLMQGQSTPKVTQVAPRVPEVQEGAQLPGKVPSLNDVQSSNHAKAGYDPASRTMAVQYKNGDLWEYKPVAPEKYETYKTAGTPGDENPSKASYFHDNIKTDPSIRGRKIGVVKQPGSQMKQALGGK